MSGIAFLLLCRWDCGVSALVTADLGGPLLDTDAILPNTWAHSNRQFQCQPDSLYWYCDRASARPCRRRFALIDYQPDQRQAARRANRRGRAAANRRSAFAAGQQAAVDPRFCRGPWRKPLHGGRGIRSAGGIGLSAITPRRRLL